MALCDTRESFDAVAENHAAWKVKYFHDVDKIMEINVPVVNIGAFGPGRAYAHRAGRHGADLPKRAQYHLRGDLVHAQLTVDTHQRA